MFKHTFPLMYSWIISRSYQLMISNAICWATTTFYIIYKKLIIVKIILSNIEQQMTNQTHLLSERIHHWTRGSMFTNKAPDHLHNTDVYVCGRSLILYVYMYIWTSVFAYFREYAFVNNKDIEKKNVFLDN